MVQNILHHVYISWCSTNMKIAIPSHIKFAQGRKVELRTWKEPPCLHTRPVSELDLLQPRRNLPKNRSWARTPLWVNMHVPSGFVWWSSCLVTTNPLLTNSLPWVITTKGKIFKVRNPIGNFHDKWEIHLLFTMAKALDHKVSQWNQRNKWTFKPIQKVQEILWHSTCSMHHLNKNK